MRRYPLSSVLSDEEEVHINIAPLVDVFLLLLFICIVTMPVVQTSIGVDLPQTKASPRIHQKNKAFVLSLSPNGELVLQKKKVQLETLADALHTLTDHNLETVIQLHVDKALPYQKVFEVMNALVSAGYHKVALNAEVR